MQCPQKKCQDPEISPMLTQVQQANMCHISLEQSKTALKRTKNYGTNCEPQNPVLPDNSGSLITVMALLNYHASSSKAHDPFVLFFFSTQQMKHSGLSCSSIFLPYHREL